ncbi:unnamed protein product [Gongylonema pulchrum]|uniref:Type II toxin-antitoxin system Phd/YefM family antitoxin n=1 Tax=Gongylonema pulchrum TaxID=637853 RepID=A0A183DIC8_9BILA|nr:unnamed protein product [Gongylonema pulchrum]
MGRRFLSEERLVTFIAEIEAIANFRPLTKVKKGPVEVLRPIDFINPLARIGNPLEETGEDEDYQINIRLPTKEGLMDG